jgi:predicted NBD/HSP70 family sugar kinase
MQELLGHASVDVDESADCYCRRKNKVDQIAGATNAKKFRLDIERELVVWGEGCGCSSLQAESFALGARENRN